ncbi:hypothetical protein COHA_001852 [Chlorella ohadii]|uniref:Topo IA-type catalytic domain-containing protein n=1 Tax=Chlorella ohadii TaxID=2649997 RepID=A0AAD5DXQ7_9CHLO|nr:hypothetical protein COHA_001852 [Chlorella ohadii]
MPLQVREVRAGEHTQERPPPPFSTPQLVQDGLDVLDIRGPGARTRESRERRVMKLLRDLEAAGFITNPDSASEKLPAATASTIRAYLKSKFGPQFAAPRSRYVQQKQGVDHAHAILPTKFETTADDVRWKLQPAHAQLYAYICGRALASQGAVATEQQTDADFASLDGSLVICTKAVVVHPGFKVAQWCAPVEWLTEVEEEAAQESALAALLRSLEVGSTARVLDARIVEEWQVLQGPFQGKANAEDLSCPRCPSGELEYIGKAQDQFQRCSNYPACSYSLKVPAGAAK